MRNRQATVEDEVDEIELREEHRGAEGGNIRTRRGVGLVTIRSQAFL